MADELAKKAQVKMEMRMMALVRQATPHAKPELLDAASTVDPLIKLLVANVPRKKDYEELFASPDATDAFCDKYKLTDRQSRLLTLMQLHKDIFHPMPWLDRSLTFIFLSQCAYILYDLHNNANFLVMFLACMAVVAITVKLVQAGFGAFGNWISNIIFRKGLVDGYAPPLSGPKQLKKWNDQSWQLFVHAVAALVELYILSGEPWWTDTTHTFIPHPMHGTQTDHSTLLQVFYLGQLAVWTYTCILHRFFDERRRDYYVLYLHHIVTIALISLSWHANYLRIGLLVLYVHDISDIFVDVLKMVNYLKLEASKGYFASEIVYVFTLSAWVWWRLVRFPFTVIDASLVRTYEAHGPPLPPITSLLTDRATFNQWITDTGVVLPSWASTNCFLAILLVMHCYWFYVLSMVGYRILTESVREASRQEYEGDSDEGENPSSGASATIRDAPSKAYTIGAGTATTTKKRGAAALAAAAVALVDDDASATETKSKGGKRGTSKSKKQ